MAARIALIVMAGFLICLAAPMVARSQQDAPVAPEKDPSFLRNETAGRGSFQPSLRWLESYSHPRSHLKMQRRPILPAARPNPLGDLEKAWQDQRSGPVRLPVSETAYESVGEQTPKADSPVSPAPTPVHAPPRLDRSTAF
jgi:hypothetical protein